MTTTHYFPLVPVTTCPQCTHTPELIPLPSISVSFIPQEWVPSLIKCYSFVSVCFDENAHLNQEGAAGPEFTHHCHRACKIFARGWLTCHETSLHLIPLYKCHRKKFCSILATAVCPSSQATQVSGRTQPWHAGGMCDCRGARGTEHSAGRLMLVGPLSQRDGLNDKSCSATHK